MRSCWKQCKKKEQHWIAAIKVRDGSVASVTRVFLLKYRDEILQPPSCLSIQVIISVLFVHTYNGRKTKNIGKNLKKLHTFIPFLVHLVTFIAISLRGNIHVWLGCTKMWSRGITMVSHWLPPDLYICYWPISNHTTLNWNQICSQANTTKYYQRTLSSRVKLDMLQKVSFWQIYEK